MIAWFINALVYYILFLIFIFYIDDLAITVAQLSSICLEDS